MRMEAASTLLEIVSREGQATHTPKTCPFFVEILYVLGRLLDFFGTAEIECIQM
jgi:hypothetical protein